MCFTMVLFVTDPKAWIITMKKKSSKLKTQNLVS